jgi:hypothetical protein
MRCIVLVKATEESEAGVMPDEEYVGRMIEFNEELVKAGVMLAGEGLYPSSKGARVKFSAAGDPQVVEGPFPETKELVAGYWIWEVQSLEDAIDWARRIPAPEVGMTEGVVEIRPIFEAEDFGADFSPEIRERELRLQEEVAKRT